ncbi:unnamed protein product [Moneuplotes crassus]|uniref:Uncharacterized protein n=1 Tax=Euplotes crassus TaxID=5936 RepID=A0AAD1XZB5_EUPCR|nr:unnamed protein product [Moneuplotes crassus]
MEESFKKFNIWLLNNSYRRETTLFRILYDMKYRKDYYMKVMSSASNKQEFETQRIATDDSLHPDRKNCTILPFEESLYLEHYISQRLCNLALSPFLVCSLGAFLCLKRSVMLSRSQSNYLFLTINNRRRYFNTMNTFLLFMFVLNTLTLSLGACILGYQTWAGFKRRYAGGLDFERQLKLKYLEQIKLYRDVQL